MSRPQSAVVNDIVIADILGRKYRLRIDVGKGDIDPPLVLTFLSLQLGRSAVTTTTTMTTTKTLREHKLGHGIQPQPKVTRNSSLDFRIIRMSAGWLPICRGFNTIRASVSRFADCRENPRIANKSRTESIYSTIMRKVVK